MKSPGRVNMLGKTSPFYHNANEIIRSSLLSRFPYYREKGMSIPGKGGG